MQYEGIAKHLDKQIPGDWLAMYYEMFPDGIERNNNNGKYNLLSG